MIVRVFLSGALHRFLEMGTPPSRQKFNSLIRALLLGEWRKTARIYKTHYERLPYVFEFALRRGLWVMASFSESPGQEGHTLRLWGVVYTDHRQRLRAGFPRGGPWLGGRPKAYECVRNWSPQDLQTHHLCPQDDHWWQKYLPWFQLDVRRFREEAAPPTQLVPRAVPGCRRAISKQDELLFLLEHGEVAIPEQMKVPVERCGLPPALTCDEVHVRELVRTTEGVTVLVPDPSDVARLEKSLPGAEIAVVDQADTIHDTVVLWYLFGAGQPSLLATGLARHRHHVIVLERLQDAYFLKEEPLCQYFFSDEKGLLSALLVAGLHTTEDWRKAGLVYLSKRAYVAARYCFMNAGDGTLLLQAQAGMCSDRRQYAEAARLFESAGRLSQAAHQYEHMGAFDKALEIWQRVRDRAGSLRCRIALLEADGKWLELGKIMSRSGAWHSAATYYEKGAAFEEAARIHQKHLDRWDEALRLYLQADNKEQAARILERQGAFKRAAQLYLAAGQEALAERMLRRIGDADGLRILFEETRQTEKLQKLLEKSKDLDRYLPLLKHYSKEELTRLGLEYLQQRKYFAAYAHLFMGEKWPEAALAATRIKWWREAGEAWLKNASYLRAGEALSKAGSYKQALLAYLEVETGADGFVKSRRMLSKIDDPSWLGDLGRKLLDQELFTRAAWLFGKLNEPVLHGCAVLMCDSEEAALNSWKTLEEAEAYDRVCAFCLRHNRLATGARLVLEVDPCFPLWYNGRIQPRITPHIFQLMAAYFQEHKDHTGQIRWGRRLQERDRFGRYIFRTIDAFEACEYYGDCLLVLFRWQEEEGLWQDILLTLREQLKEAHTALSRSLRLFFLDKRPMPDLSNVRLHLGNAPMFFLSGQKNQELVALLRAELNRESGSGQLRREIVLALAHIAEQRRDLPMAVHFLLLGGKVTRALRFLQQVKDPFLQGHALALIGKYDQALAQFQAARKIPDRWRARCLEALGRYVEAIELYETKGDTASVERCRARIQSHP